MEPLNQQTQPPIENPVPPAAPTPEPVQEYAREHKGHVVSARSFSSDLANAIREKGGSVVRIAIAEEEKNRREFQENSATSRKNIFFIVATIIIIVGAIGAVVFVYLQKKAASVVVPVTTVLPTAIVTAEDSQTIDLSGMQRSEAYAAIGAVVTTPNIQPGTIKNIVIMNSVGGMTTRISGSQLISTLGMQAPDLLLRSLSKEYMLGVYVRDSSNLFFILKGTAHDFLLSGILAWEPKLFNDMVPLFSIDTSSFTKAQLQSLPFVDTVIENRDARAVLDANKKPILFYSFLDPDTIIIATDPKTLTEVVRRY